MSRKPPQSSLFYQKLLSLLIVALLFVMPIFGFLSQHQNRFFEDWSMFDRGVVPVSEPICQAEFKYRNSQNKLESIERNEFQKMTQAGEGWGFDTGFFFRIFIYDKNNLVKILRRLCPAKNNEIYVNAECFYQDKVDKIESDTQNACAQL